MKTLSINRILIAAFITFGVAFLFSCQKESNLNSSTELTEDEAASYSDEGAQADGSFDDVTDVSMFAADAESEASTGRTTDVNLGVFIHLKLRVLIGDCATVTVYPNDSTYPKTITLDFGNGCVGLDGKWRSGKIVIHLTAPIRQPGAVMTVTFVDFHLNRAHIEGTKVVTNLSQGNTIKFSVQVTGGKVTFPNGRGYQYEAFKYKKQIEGMNTNIHEDNVFQITGWAKIKYNNGLTINFDVVDPLIKKVSCPWLSDGTLKIKINNRVLKIDYGFPNNGNCDNKALLTWNNGNNQRVILLP